MAVRTIMDSMPRAAILGGIGLVAIWLVAGAATRPAGRPAGAVGSADSRVPADPLAEDLRVQAERLRYQLTPSPIPRAPARNPFEFASRPQPPPPRESAPLPDLLPQLSLVQAPTRPPFSLVAISQTGSTRTAILSMSDQVLLVKVGDQVASRFKVAAIGADAVEMIDTLDNTTSRLGLR